MIRLTDKEIDLAWVDEVLSFDPETDIKEHAKAIAKAQLKKDIEDIRKGLLVQFAIWTNTQNNRTFVIDIQAWDEFWQSLLEEVE